MKKQFARVLSFMMALMMVVATFGTVAVFAADDVAGCEHPEDKATVLYEHAPQCNAIGFTTYKCECGVIYTGNVQGKIGCVGVAVNATEATCTDPAYADGEQCQWCGTIIRGCEPVGEPLGHEMDYVTVDASCTQINKIVYGCQVCDYVELDPVDLPDVINPEEPDGHNFVYEIVTRPSCELEEVTATTPGAYAVYEGEGGNAVLLYYTTKDAVCVVENGVVSDPIYIVVTTNGTAKYACTDCDRTYTEIIVKWNDTLHVWEDKAYGEDTCTTTGYTWVECSVCGMYKADSFVVVEEIVHKFATATEEELAKYLEANPDATITEAYVEATCTAEGHDLQYCPNCETYDLKTLTKEHNWQVATDEQLATYNTDQEEANKLLVADKASTCTEKGWTLNYCDGCEGFDLVEKELASHTKGEFDHAYVATCTEAGVNYYDCPNCDDFYTEAGDAALGHDFAYSCPACGEDVACNDCTHKDRIATCQREGCGLKEAATHEEHDFEDQLYYSYFDGTTGETKSGLYTEGFALCDVNIQVYKVCECDSCDYEEDVKVVVADPVNGTHAWVVLEGEKRQEATCEEDGWAVVVCKLCNLVAGGVDENGKAKALIGSAVCEYTHKADDDKTNDVCNSGDGVTIVDGCFKAYGHNYISDPDDTTEATTATCITPGYTPAQVCEHCGDIKSEAVEGEVNPNNHENEPTITTVPGSCTKTGYEIRTYSCCGTIDLIPIEGKNTTNHVYITIDEKTGAVSTSEPNFSETVEYKAPTCGAAGNEAYKKCLYCQLYVVMTEDGVALEEKDYVTQATIPVIETLDEDNHPEFGDVVAYLAPTCTEAGNESYKQCKVCEKYVVLTEDGVALDEADYETVDEIPVIDPTNHTTTTMVVPAKKEGCNTFGWYEYSFCYACTELPEGSDAFQMYIPSLYEDDTPWLDTSNIYYATAIDDEGNYSTVGMYFITGDGSIILPHGDEFQVTVTEEEAVAPTCTTPGLAAGTYCMLCDGEYVGKEWDETTLYSENSPFYIAPLGHTNNTPANDQYGQWASVTFNEGCDANADVYCCEKYMCTAYWCVWCHDVEALAWDEVEYEFDENGAYAIELDDENAATWYVEVDYFKNGHDWVEDTVAPTCTVDGYNFKYCQYCACVEIGEVIEAKGHIASNGDELDLSCANIENVIGKYCVGCGLVTAADAEHNWAHVEIEETCLDDGLEFWHCTWCYEYAVENEDGELEITERENAEQIIDDITPDEHLFGSIVADSYVAPTTTADGAVQYICDRCGATVDVVIPMLDGSLNLQILPSTYDLANGDTFQVAIVLNSNYEEGFEFSSMELHFEYNSAMFEFVGYTVDHDDTIATEAASNESLYGGDASITVISYATEDSVNVTTDAAYITLSFKVKGAISSSNYILGSPDMFEPAWFDFCCGEAYDEDGYYMENAEFTAYNEDVEFLPMMVEGEYANGYNFGDGIEFYPDLTGDIDYNGRIDTGDLVAFRDLVKAKEYDNVADINKDGVVNGADIVLLNKFLATNRTYCDYQAMMGVDWWAEFEAAAAEALPYINLILDAQDKEHLAYLLDEYISWTEDFELYEEDAALLASIILSIKDDITLEQFMTAAKMMGVLTEEMGVNYYGMSVDYATEALMMITLQVLVNNGIYIA